ncbi:acyltransferase [Microbulbifer agarilyticus]|uniref:acyltransferase family protein n=1 Tax=Microbulbifer agarilyticus TaxID=260552 RepID=UPI001C989815|nr:acyltransferase family protein [Microbulbifer agarilyticus]MBY6190250.1 acyltransferase [Microbulbifer agarilyticus]MBY6210255.1 acyltransferase [Microbulbifer agarilyticus]
MQLKYRADIDGLRTIAVLSVIIYHAEIVLFGGKLLPGGYLGVDIFFVISGYLITSLMIKELRNTDTISISDFYARRARRLLPALFAVLTFCLPMAWYLLLSDSLVDFVNSLVASLLFGSNIYWNYSLQAYGAESALLKPLMHTWSLAVEEQYYLIFPMLMILMYRYCKGWILHFFVVSIVASLCFAEWMSARDSSFSFYMLPSRIWELFAGALVAYLISNNWINKEKTPFYKAFPYIGILLIAYSLVYISFSSAHPGFITIIPVLGAVMVIACPDSSNLVTRLLSTRGFVGVGLISYSLYLWHYPLFAFLRISNSFETLAIKLLSIGAVFILAYVSYRWIEKPFRKPGQIPLRKTNMLASSFVAVFLGFSLVVIKHDGFDTRLPTIVKEAQVEVNLCEDNLHCTFNEGGDRALYLLGDSHMMTLESSLLEYSSNNNVSFHVLTQSGCMYVPNMDRVRKENGKATRCTSAVQERRREILLSGEPGVVVVGGRLPLILSEDRFDNQEGKYEGEMEYRMQYPSEPLGSREQRAAAISREYAAALLELAKFGHQVVLLYPVPEVGWHVAKQLKSKLSGKSENEMRAELDKNPISTSYAVFQERVQASARLLDSVQHENIVRVYPHKLFCNTKISGRCITHDLEQSFYRDDDHLSLIGAAMLQAEILQAANI